MGSVYCNGKLVFSLWPVGDVPERELMRECFTGCKRRNLNCRIVGKGFIEIKWSDGNWKVGATVHLGGSTESHTIQGQFAGMSRTGADVLDSDLSVHRSMEDCDLDLVFSRW